MTSADVGVLLRSRGGPPTVARGSSTARLEAREESGLRAAGLRSPPAAWGRRAEDREGDLDQVELLGDPAERPGIAGTAYDTAWLALVPVASGFPEPRFPTALQWLSENQQPDGSWGGAIRYEHDRVLCTLVALTALAAYGRRRADRLRLAAGTRYLWQRGHLLGSEPVELVGFELLLPTLVQRARRLGIAVPPHLDIYRRQRAAKLSLLPAEVLYSARTTVAHSLEFLGDDADPARLREAVGANGAIGNSPAATAFYLARNDDDRARAYLEECLRRGNGATAPVLYPCETFELLWAAYHFFLAGVPASRLLAPADREILRAALRRDGGVSLSPTFAIPDADDTAVALLLLHALGETVDVGILRAFAVPAGYFASFPYERHSSVGVNLHVLHALLRVPGYPDQASTVEHLLDYLLEQQMGGLYWIDKWHISPYYATAHAVCCLRELRGLSARRARPALDRAREWLRQTQNADGSWGFYGAPTAEETAYAMLALATENRIDGRDQRRIAAALRFLRAEPAGDGYPPLWIDKCLYTPTLVVRAAIEAARAVGARVVPLVTEPVSELARRPVLAARAS